MGGRHPSSQLGSFVSLALKAKDQKTARLTIGPPDFGTAADNFVTYPDFSKIHPRVQKLFTQETETEKKAKNDGGGSGGGETSGGGAKQPKKSAPNPADTPVSADPQITEEYLQQLAEIGDTATIGSLLADNGKCSLP